MPEDSPGRSGGTQEIRRTTRSTKLADGTLACPACDAPVAPLQRTMAPADPLGCGYCLHQGPLRDFLSLTHPTRPTHVSIYVRSRRITQTA